MTGDVVQLSTTGKWDTAYKYYNGIMSSETVTRIQGSQCHTIDAYACSQNATTKRLHAVDLAIRNR